MGERSGNRPAAAGTAALLIGIVGFALAAFHYRGRAREDWRALVESQAANGRMQARIQQLEDQAALLQRRLAEAAPARENERLRRDIDKLNEILDLREQEIGQLQARSLESTPDAPRRADGPRRGKDAARPAGFSDRLERLRKEDPGRYARIKSRMAEYEERRKALVRRRDDFFAGLDRDRMTEEQQALVSDYLTLIQLNRDLAAEGGAEDRRELWKNNRLLLKMQDEIREALLQLEFRDRSQADRVREIYEITSPRAVLGATRRF